MGAEDVSQTTGGAPPAAGAVAEPPAPATKSAAELREELAAAEAAEAAEKTQQTEKPLLEQVTNATDAEGAKPSFIDRVRIVTQNLISEGKLVENDLLSSEEEAKVAVVFHKLLGEVIDKVASL